MAIIALVCVLTFLHYVGAQMRGPVLSLYAAAHGATPTGVGLIIGAHMLAAAVGSIPSVAHRISGAGAHSCLRRWR
ncbi:MAG: MFS transporter [Chloroflexi bacterium]|nr:MAG: MFS transporter [Chloroflexota bacterium]